MDTPKSSKYIPGMQWNVIPGSKIVLSPGLILAVCSPQSGGKFNPIEYPILDSFSIPYLERTFLQAASACSQVLPGLICSNAALMPSTAISAVSITICFGFPIHIVLAIGE